ncbi:TerB family tellurite resistance protein [Microseira wollei]|uniref:Co-chaperone DjlA N-terminal domain-containing protein n=1 Tax=Microseira wollei NIES-4236 TaxID=2530354 RepID=A0AAV3XPD3_9CYAN|nr:TerB family tellurite resistance protein [Microseira wollei]GET44404.1 hypothetical protein MiSe_92310 [Microseira wollei NIES-4236]
MTSDSTRKMIGNWFYRQSLNFKQQPADDVIEYFAKALLIAAKGDRVLSQAERDWVVGLTAAKGGSEQLIEELKNYSADEDVEQVIASHPFSDQGRRTLIYTAIQACGADGEYNEAEKACIRKIAALLKVSEDVVKEIEELCEQEKAQFQKRIKLLYPDGHPLLVEDNNN